MIFAVISASVPVAHDQQSEKRASAPLAEIQPSLAGGRGDVISQ
jgi:hypothetical protein